MFPRHRRKITFLALSLASAGLCLSCGNAQKHFTAVAYGYGTTWDIHLYQGTQEDCDAIVSIINATSQVLDEKATSNKHGVYTLNQVGSVDADPFLLEAIELGERLTQECQGAFSYTIGKLTSAWLSALEQKKILPESELALLLAEASATSLSLNGKTVTKTGNGTIDFGAIGKGLCLDRIATYLKEKGITQYLIDGGTSSILLGDTPDKNAVKINLSDAEGHYFYGKECAISCSSVSKQGTTIDGVTYSHIIDPRTGDAHLAQDALYLKSGGSAAYLDGLSTAYLVLGEEGVSGLENKGVQYAYCKGGKVVRASQDFIL